MKSDFNNKKISCVCACFKKSFSMFSIFSRWQTKEGMFDTFRCLPPLTLCIITCHFLFICPLSPLCARHCHGPFFLLTFYVKVHSLSYTCFSIICGYGCGNTSIACGRTTAIAEHRSILRFFIETSYLHIRFSPHISVGV